MSTTYYYLKLPEDFFDKHYVKIIRKLPNGNEILLFLIKLYVESVPHAATLRFSDDLPYTNEMLADITDTDINIVKEAMSYFESVKIVEKMDDGTIWLPMADKLIGKETDAAKRMKERRETLKNKDCSSVVQKCSQNVQESSKVFKDVQKCSRILDIDLDIELDNYSSAVAEIITYLNDKVHASYRTSTRKTRDLIKARMNEGFKVEDFKTVIDKKSAEWMNTEMEKYLRPYTLFGTKFESYLNQSNISNYKTNRKNNFNNFDQRDYDYDSMEDLFFNNKGEEK